MTNISDRFSPPDIIRDLHSLLQMGRYYTRSELKYHLPKNAAPEKADELWELIKLSRTLSAQTLPYTPISLTYNLTPDISGELHLLDQNVVRLLPLAGDKLRESQEIIFEALSDEAINSSKLEGAVTTEIAAREMIRKNILPQTKDERMIMNNHVAMQFIRTKKDVRLTPEFMLEIQRMVTEGTLENPSHAGMFRNTDDVYVVKPSTAEVLYYPSKAADIPRLIADLCSFVNTDRIHPNESPFVHPLIVGIALHFLIGYIHPFYDGNGRTARTLFYWYMLSRGYGVFQYIPISKIIRQSPGKYRDAYLASEEDGLDLTYFILYNISCIKQARELAASRMSTAQKKADVFTSRVLSRPGVSRRQAAILWYMAEHTDELFSIAEIKEQFNVSYQTARTDLMNLEARGYLRAEKSGHAFLYATENAVLKELLQG